MTIGRSAENDIALADWEVSRWHARMSLQNSTWVIEDLGSSNGIIFSGKRVEENALENSEQLTEEMKVFEAMIKYQSPHTNPNRTNPGFMRLQGALLSTPIFNSLGKGNLEGWKTSPTCTFSVLTRLSSARVILVAPSTLSLMAE